MPGKKRILFILLIFLNLHLSACDLITEVKDAFFGEEKKEAVTEKKKKVKKAVEKETAEETTPAKSPPPSPQPLPLEGGGERGEGDQREEEKATPVDTKPHSPAPQAKVPPLTPLDHFGGKPGFLFFDGEMLYAGFGRRLVFYDQALNEISSISLEAEIEKIVPRKGPSGNLIYVAEKENLLEIITFPSPAVPSEILKTFEIGGPFEVEPDSNRLFVYLTDKIQILDLKDLNKVAVIAEAPLGGVSEMAVFGGYYYVVHGTSLTIVEGESLSVLASLPLGSPFKILGKRDETDGSHLLLLLQSPQTGKRQTLRWMPLAADGSGITDQGKSFGFTSAVDEAVPDRDQPYLYLLRDGVLSVFDFSRQIEMTIPSSTPVRDIRAIDGGKGIVFAASSAALGRFGYLSPQAVPLEAPVTKPQQTSPPPLAGATSESKKPESLVWKSEKTIPLAGSVEMLWLPSHDTALFAGDSLFYSRSFLTGTSVLTPLKPPKNQTMKFTLGLSYGGTIFLFDETSGKVFLVKSDFSGLQEVALAAQNIVGMERGSDGKGDYLYLAVAKKDGRGETALLAYQFQSPLMVKKIGSLSFEEIGGFGLYAGSTRAVAACGSAGVCLADVGTERNKIKLLTTVASSQKGAKAVEVKVSPDEKAAYVFYEKADGAFISIVDLSGDAAKELAVIPNVKMTASQFRGITFTSGGKILLMPDDEGLAVYNVGNPKNPVFAYRWPVGRAFHADVTNRGKTVCVALGANGVECGSFESGP